jgi:hypothetical protein
MSRKTAVVLVLALLVATPLAAATVQGVVISTDGQAIPGATVRAYAFDSTLNASQRLLSDSPERNPVAEATADARGKFTVEIKPSLGVQIVATAPGFAPSGTRAAAGEDVGTIALRGVPSVKGRITAAGKPLSDALVLLSGIDGGLFTVRTDEEGRYEAPDPSKWAGSMTVVHPEIGWYRRGRTVASRLSPEVAIAAPITISGRIVAEDGTPSAGALVRVDGMPVSLSNEDGTFSARVPADWSRLLATRGDLFAAADRRGSGELVLKLRRGAWIAGFVRDAATRRELPGATVGVQGLSERFGAGAASGETVVSDEKGRFRVGPLPPGTYNLNVDFPGYLFQTVEVPVRATETREPAIALAKAASIEGYARDEKRAAVAGAQVEVDIDPRGSNRIVMWNTRSVTGPDGRFVLRPLDASAGLDLAATKKGFPEGRVTGVSVRPGERKKDVVITIPAGVAVPIRIVDGHGRPVAAASIDAAEATTMPDIRRQVRMNRFAEADLPLTGKDGTAVVRLKSGRYDFTIRAPGFAPGRARGVDVEERMDPVEVVLAPGSEIRGRVVTKNGAPVQDVTISILSTGERNPNFATTAADGSFILSDLEKGRFLLRASKADSFLSIDKMVEAPASDVILEVPPGGSIRGRVTDKGTKQPITDFQAGFSGERSGPGMQMMGPPMIRTFSDAQGAFLLENAPVGKSNVIVIAPGYVRAEVPGVDVEEGKTAEIEIALETGSRLVGKVTAPDGAAIAGAGVFVRAEGERPSFFAAGRAQTDASGEYVVDGVEPGEKLVSFSKDGFVSDTKRVNVSGKEVRVDGRLDKGLEIGGLVVDNSGIPLADATVNVQSPTPGARFVEARTDANGGFRVEALPAGRYTFRARKQGYADGVTRDVDISATRSVRIVMEAGGSIYGTVTGFRPEDAKDIVVVAAASQNSGAEARIDPSGSYRLDGVPLGQVTVTAISRSIGAFSRSEEKRVNVTAGSVQQVDLAFGRGHTITGRVTREGRPVGSAIVSFQPRDRRIRTVAASTASADGYYTAEGLQEGEYDVMVSERSSMQGHSAIYTVQGSARYDIEMRSTSLRGTVVDASTGEPLPGATIALVDAGRPRFISATSDQRGAFTLEGLSEGSHQLRAEKKGYGQQILDVTVSTTPPQDVRFTLSPAAGIRVKVVDARDGRSISASVAAFDAAGRVAGNASGGPDGVATLPLAPGVYRLVVGASGLAAQNVRVSVPSAEFVVGLTPGGRLLIRSNAPKRQLGRMLLPGGEPYVRGWWEPSGQIVLEPGLTTLENVSPGTYTVVLLDDSGNAATSKQVTILEGRTAEVAF